MDTSQSPMEAAARLSAGIARIIAHDKKSVAAIARQTGIPYSTLSRKLAGGSVFNFAEIDALSRELHYTPSQLIDVAMEQ